MSNKQAPTKRQRDERARRIAMGIAVIQRPLRYIATKTNTRNTDEHGVSQIIESFQYTAAKHAAKNGDGFMVNWIARKVCGAAA